MIYEPRLLVIFGAGGEKFGRPHDNDYEVTGGDLFGRKLLSALWLQYQQSLREETSPFPVRIVLADPNKVRNTARYLEKVASLNRGNSRILAERHQSKEGAWESFLTRFCHVPTGDSVESAAAVFAEIRSFKMAHPSGKLIFYLAIPYTKNTAVMNQIRHIVKELRCHADSYVLFEKPAYLKHATGVELKRLVIDSGIQMGRAQQVEHFLPKFRYGLKQFQAFAYEEVGNNQLLNSKHVDQVRVRMIEPVGSENRADYPGTLGDSGPHIAAVLGMVLGDPRIIEPTSEALLQRVERLMPKMDVPDDADDHLLADNARECYRNLRLRGIYACCRQDHGAWFEHVPTGCYMEMFPQSLAGERWPGETRFIIQHQKCGPKEAMEKNVDERLAHLYGAEIPTGKCYEISYRLKFDPAVRGPAIWRMVFDGRIPGSNLAYCWWTKSTSSYGEPDRIYDFSGFNRIPDEFAETYNMVIASVLQLRMDDFMDLRWQHAVDRIFIGGVSSALNATDPGDIDLGGPGRRIWFNWGEDAFARPDLDEKLIELDSSGETVHVPRIVSVA